MLVCPRGFSGRSLGCTRLSSDAKPWEGCAEPSDVPLVSAVAVKSPSKAILRRPELMGLLVCRRFAFPPALRTGSSCCMPRACHLQPPAVPHPGVTQQHPKVSPSVKDQPLGIRNQAGSTHSLCIPGTRVRTHLCKTR